MSANDALATVTEIDYRNDAAKVSIDLRLVGNLMTAAGFAATPVIEVWLDADNSEHDLEDALPRALQIVADALN